VTARRCGFGVPFEKFDPVTRKALENFEAYLAGKVALAADGRTYVPVGSPDAVHVVAPSGCMDMWHFSRGEATGPCPTCGDTA
jgi:hypothetical protein